jgi:anti-anti-sigma factor
MVTYDTFERDGAKVVKFAGRLTAVETRTVKNDIYSIATSAPGDIIFDVSDLELLASDGLAMIIEARHKALKNKRQLVIVCCNDNIREVFEITKLFKIFKIYDSLDEALKQ